jgi:hypothetical protein
MSIDVGVVYWGEVFAGGSDGRIIIPTKLMEPCFSHGIGALGLFQNNMVGPTMLKWLSSPASPTVSVLTMLHRAHQKEQSSLHCARDRNLGLCLLETIRGADSEPYPWN